MQVPITGMDGPARRRTANPGDRDIPGSPRAKNPRFCTEAEYKP